MREHDVAALTAAELEAARRELAASLALAPSVPGPTGRARVSRKTPPHSWRRGSLCLALAVLS